MVTARGTDVIMADPDYQAKLPEVKESKNQLAAEATIRGDGLAPMVALFSSSPSQYSLEYRGGNGEHYGLFSYSFSKSLANLGKNATYRELFDRIRLEISSFTQKQTPQFEGMMDQPVLGGNTQPVGTYFSLASTPASRSDQITVRAGELQGLTTNR